uniref:Zinc finger, GRF-type containing 1 n=1 Tax=Xenopus tropicalis TaxID=8364 RepID=A0A6I8SBY6_XENTR
MAAQAFIVLYTHQKTKKSKTWQDGILKLSPEGRVATLYNDKGQHLENVYLKTNKLNSGDDLESDRYLITVEGEDLSGGIPQTSTEVREAPKISKSTLKPVGLLHPVGLKRKFSGFQGPREISKKPSLGVEGETQSPVLAQGCSSLPSQLYSASPLFATPCLKNSDAILPPDCGSLACWKNNPDGRNQTLPLTSSFSCSYSSNDLWMTESEKVDKSSSTAANVEVNSVTQKFRSRSQILALLKSQPPQQTSAALSKSNEHYDELSGSGHSDVLNTKDTIMPGKENCFVVVGQKSKYPQDIPVEPNLKKSRWDAYLEHSPPSDSEDTVNSDKDKSVEQDDPYKVQCFSSSLDLTQKTSSRKNIQGKPLSPQLSAQSENCLPPQLAEATKFHTPQTSVLHLQWKTETSNCKSYVGQEDLNTDNCSNATQPFGDISFSSEYSLQGCRDNETPISEKPVASPSLKISDTAICSSEDETSDPAMTEITFNLLDSFDCIVSDDEDSQIVCPNIKEAEHGPLGEIIPTKDRKDNVPLHCQNEKHAGNEIMESRDITDMSSGSNISRTKNYGLVEYDSKLQVLSDTVKHENCAIKEEHKEKLQNFPGTSDLGRMFDIKTELSHDKKDTTENTAHISMGNIVQPKGSLLENSTVVKEASKLSQESQRSTHNCILVLPINKSQSKMPLLENHIQSSNEGILCNQSTFDSTENIKTENSISVLKGLTKHSNAIESLDILNDDSESTTREDECSGHTDKLSGEVEEDHHKTMHDDFFQCDLDQAKPFPTAEFIFSQEFKSDNTPRFQCPEPVPPKLLSAKSLEEELFVEDFPAKPGTVHVPQGTHCNNAVPFKAFALPQWDGGTQQSDCDWDLSQWPSRETIKISCELHFPSRETVQSTVSIPKREISIPILYQSVTHYKHVFTAALTEHLNIMMFELSQRLYKALSKVDMSFYTSSRAAGEMGKHNVTPLCLHQQPAKLVMVKK